MTSGARKEVLVASRNPSMRIVSLVSRLRVIYALSDLRLIVLSAEEHNGVGRSAEHVGK